MNYFNYLLIFIVFSLLTTKVFAQDSLKTKTGDWTTELNVNLFQGELRLNNAINQVKIRYFLSGNLAIRAAIDVSNNRIKESAVNNYGTNPFSISSTRKKTSMGINIGLEKHFPGTKRLSPYIGSEIAIANIISSHIVESDDKLITVDGAWATGSTSSLSIYSYHFNQFQDRGYLSAGINLLAGFDFYFSEKIYFGYEIIYNLSYINYPTVSVTEKNISGTGTVNNYPGLAGNEWHFGPQLINGVRLGFIF